MHFLRSFSYSESLVYSSGRKAYVIYVCVCTYTIQTLLSITDTNLEQLQCYLHGPKLEQTVVC